MAEEVLSLWLSASSEYVSTFMQFEYGYPLRFASLLVDRPAFPEKLKSVRAHYDIVLKYERLAISDMGMQVFLKQLGFVLKPSVRVSWMLWSAVADDSFEKQDKRAHLINYSRFGGLGDTYSNECSNAVLREFERQQRQHMNPGGQPKEDGTLQSRQNRLITGVGLEARKVPQVVPDFTEIDTAESRTLQGRRTHYPPRGVLPHVWLSMMKGGVKEFKNPIPEGDRIEVAAWMWLLEYDKRYGSLPPHDRPEIGNGWLASLCLKGSLVEEVATGTLYLSLGNETWMVMLLPLRVVPGSSLYALSRQYRLIQGFVSNLDAWRVHPSKCMSPRACKDIYHVEQCALAWQITGPPVSLLRAALQNKISLNVEDMLNLLNMLKCAIPNPARKGDCLRNLLQKVFTDWTAEQIRKHWEEMINAPTENQKAERDIDEDVRCCLKHHLSPEQQRDYEVYADAVERMEIAERLKLKRRTCDEPHDVTLFDWGPFHFWKRPPTRVRAPHGGWSVRCGPHHRPSVDGSREVVCQRECNLKNEDDEDLTVRRLKMWALGYCCCSNKEAHFKYMRDYPADDELLTHEASSGLAASGPAQCGPARPGPARPAAAGIPLG